MTDRQILHPADEQAWLALRVHDVTSTEASALYGMSPYLTAFELWHRKRDKQVVQIPDNERMRWGRRLQDAIAAGIAEDQGWVAEPMKEYIRLRSIRMGASFDWRMLDKAGRIGNFEIKNVDWLVFRDQWHEEDGELVAPDHIEIQLQHQIHTSGYEWGAIGVLVGGNAPRVLIRERDHEVGQAIEKKVQEFWRSIDAGTPPPPDYAADSEFISKLYGFAQPGKVFDGRGVARIATLCADYHQAQQDEAAAKKRKDAAKAEMLMEVGDAEKVIADGFTISAGLVAPADVPAYTRAGYRNFRLYPKKSTTTKELQ